MKLFSYHRSSAAYRVRIVLNLKQVEHTIVPINLLLQEQLSDEYRLRQPQGLVPSLETPAGKIINQSGAIIDYLEDYHLEPVLKPNNPDDAAKVRSIVDIIACDIHPICNLRVLHYLTHILCINEKQKLTWYRHWVHEGFSALEKTIAGNVFCVGDQLTLADVYLIPQIYNALRFHIDMSTFPKLQQIYHRCNELPEFKMAKPENQTDSQAIQSH